MGRSVLCSNATFEHIRLKANGGPLTVTSTRASGTVFEAVAESIFVDMGASEFKTWGLKTFLPLVHEFRKELNTYVICSSRLQTLTGSSLLSLQPTIPPSLRPLGKGNQRPLEPTINTGIRLSEREFIELSQLSIEEQEVRARRCADEVLQHMIDEAEDQCLPSPSLSLSKDIWDQAHSDFGLALQEYTRRTRESPLVGQAGFIARERRVKGPKPKRLAAKQEKKKEPKAMSKCPADTESQKKLTKSQKKKRERARRLKMEKKKEAKRDRKASKARKAKI